MRKLRGTPAAVYSLQWTKTRLEQDAGVDASGGDVLAALAAGQSSSAVPIGLPVVTAAHFAGPVLLFVINRKVYAYDYHENKWNVAKGIGHPVSHVTGDNCCYGPHSVCEKISNSIFAYMYGEVISQANIYYSQTLGYTFEKFTFGREKELVGFVGGIFFFHSLSQVGLLVVDRRKAKFAYSEHPLNRSFGLPFDYNGTLDVHIVPDQRGILVLWSENSLLISRNAGQLVNTVIVKHRSQHQYSSILEANLTIHSIATNDNELAVLVKPDLVYYGSLGVLSSYIIQLSKDDVWSQEAAPMFTHPGVLEILIPVPDLHFPAFDFLKCYMNVQEVLLHPYLQIQGCKVELLQGYFQKSVLTLDMNSDLQLRAVMIPQLHKSPIPLVTVSNPHSLGLQVTIQESGCTLDGNIEYELTIYLKQQHLFGRADSNFTSSMKRPTISTVTVDIANREISCIDLRPLVMFISVGCDTKKKVVVQNKISACSKGILDPMILQDDYSYIIEREAHDRAFRGHKAVEDLIVFYPYEELGCPQLVYYNTPWKPVVQLWRDGSFQEVVHAEYVLLEVNGLFTYSYTLTARTAHCKWQPQNWTTMMSRFNQSKNVWNRETYESCHKPEGGDPLKWPDVPYQILGGPTDNKVIFDQRNGMYIFHLYIVDPYYSYCGLETTFSVYVYGAFPSINVRKEVTIALLLLSLLLSLWLAYAIPKALRTDTGHRVTGFWARLLRGFRNDGGASQPVAKAAARAGGLGAPGK
ncbi:cation channel sperm-associated protein subunit delta [Orycteropus afer afer]|uniref:Cation channel sperm-associated auxiliary subunit delta n=1 Tax=Orycteropus afer afer TaxID=1230840 RepID=A0A8B7AXJ7_ORYAF|nr:cation channel sperm-associated protein subunit delta [Orycteropus afer afer]